MPAQKEIGGAGLNTSDEEQGRRNLTELEQRNREMSLLSEMGSLLQSCLTAEEAYTIITEFARQSFPAESGTVCVLETVQNLVQAVAFWGEFTACERVFARDDCWALRRGRAHWVENVRSPLLCQHISHPVLGSYICMPMMARGEALGVLHLQARPHEHLTESKQRLAQAAAEQVALALANLKLQESWRNQSLRDPLTTLFNRRYMEESLGRELRRATRNRRSLSAVMLDVDHFKRFNDNFGHEAGDALLRALADFLQKHVRGEDIACRYGGEEFVLILPEASSEVAARRAEHLREQVKRLSVQHRGQLLGGLTLSLGVATFPEHASTVADLLRVADSALYRAKAEGRDRVVAGDAAT